jgi:hypothetical protein
LAGRIVDDGGFETVVDIIFITVGLKCKRIAPGSAIIRMLVETLKDAAILFALLSLFCRGCAEPTA